MKILNVITDLAMGGTEITLEKIIKFDSENRHIILCLNEDRPVGTRLRKNGIEILDLKIKNLFSTFSSIYKIINFLRKNKNIDVIQGWMYHGNIVAFLINIFLKKKLIWNIRQSLDNVIVEKKLTQRIIYFSKYFSKSKNLSKIIYNSEKAQNDHEKIGFNQKKSVLIFNGYSSQSLIHKSYYRDEFIDKMKLPKNIKIVGHVARLHPVKDHVNFILASQKILKQDLNYFFIMVGREVNCEKIKNILQNLKITKNFLLIDELKNPSDYFRIFDLTVNSSWAEAFPNVVAESIINYTPCIATKVGDADRILNYDKNFLVPPRNPLMLYDCIIKYFNLDEKTKSKKINLLNKYITEKFSLENLIKNYNKIYL